MILPGRADLQGEVPPFLVSPGLDQRSRRRWIWKFQQFGHCWSSHLKRMLPPSRDDHMNIFTALKVTKRPHAGSMPSWNIYFAEKTNTEKMYLSMERYPIDTLFQTFRSLFWGGFTSSAQPEISADPTTVAGLKIPEMGKFGIQTSDFGFGQLEFETDDRQIKIQDGWI